jgi:hypothetical protein
MVDYFWIEVFLRINMNYFNILFVVYFIIWIFTFSLGLVF